MSEPRASVIVLGYNGKEFLGRCLGSVLDQSYPAEDYEVIYADNASSDGSAELVRERFPSIRVLQFERNHGFAGGNNEAVNTARGRYLLFLNQDAVAHRHWVAEMVAAMESDPGAAAGHAAGCPLHDGYLELEAPVERGYISEVSSYGAVEPVEIRLPHQPLPTLHVGGGSMIIDREVLDELDYLFDASFFAYCEDLDLGLRLNGIGQRVVFVPTAVCYHHREGRTRPSRKTLQRTGLATRNRFVAYMKNMYASEFLFSLPRLFWGTMAKMRGLVGSPVQRFIFGLGLVPFTAYHLLRSVAKMPHYLPDRRRILKRRAAHHEDRRWLMKELRHRGALVATWAAGGE